LIVAFADTLLGTSINSIPTRDYNSTLIYDVVLVCVLGGIGLSGGRGGVLSAVVGTLLIGATLNAMTILVASYSY
jgi:ribose transport system permease protein